MYLKGSGLKFPEWRNWTGRRKRVLRQRGVAGETITNE